MKFSKVLKKYRSKTKKTQQDVVDTLACDPDFEAISTVSYHRWESGKNLPSIKRQAKILLLLNCKKDLQKLASIYQGSVSSLEAMIEKRWNKKRFGFDYDYDPSSNNDIRYEVLRSATCIPKESLVLQQRFYANKEACILVSPEEVFNKSKHNLALIARSDNLIYGQMWFHLMTSRDLQSVFNKMEYNSVQTLSSLGISEDEEVVFLSSFHSTRQDVYITFLKLWLEEIFELDSIPRYTYFRVIGNPGNSFIGSLLSPILLTKGSTFPPRINHINTKYEWLGYLIPNHLLVLVYGGVLHCYKNITK